VREPQDEPVSGRQAFGDAIVGALALARHDVLMLDPDFSGWPLGRADGAQALRAMLSRGVRVRMLLIDPTWLATRADRFLALHRAAAGRCAIRRLPERLLLEESTLVVDRQHLVRRPHPASMNGRMCIAMPSAAEPHAERLAAAWDESSDCLPATTLGL
jgi:hypothetical protein